MLNFPRRNSIRKIEVCQLNWRVETFCFDVQIALQRLRRPTAWNLNQKFQSVWRLTYSTTIRKLNSNSRKPPPEQSHLKQMFEANKTNMLLKQKLDEYDIANKRFQESLNKKINRIKDRNELQMLVKQLQTMRVEINIQRAEATQLIQTVNGKQHETLEKCLHDLLTHANHSDWKDMKKNSIFDVKRGNIKNCMSTIYYPIDYSFDKGPDWKNKCTRLFRLVDPEMYLLHRRNENFQEQRKHLNSLILKFFITNELSIFIKILYSFNIYLT